MNYDYREMKVSKDSAFPELDILNMALDSVSEHYNKLNEQLYDQWFLEHKIDRKTYEKRAQAIKDAKDRAMGLVKVIRDAMNEYEVVCEKLSSYESQKMDAMLSLIGDKKILKVYNSELGKINAQKRQAKEQLIKALTDKNLKTVGTVLSVRNGENNQYIVSEKIKGAPGVDVQNLQQIISTITSNSVQKIANQHVERTEIDSIEERKVYQNKNYEWVQDLDSVHIATAAAPIHVRDGEMKKTVDFNNLSDEEKIKRLQELMSNMQPEIGEIEIILRSQTHLTSLERKRLIVTKAAYKEMSQINLEVDRVRVAIEYLKDSNSRESLPKTQELLSKYYAKLIQQQKDQLEKVKNLTTKSKLNDFISIQEQKEQLERAADKRDYFDKQAEASAILTGKPDPRIEEQRRKADEEYHDILDEMIGQGRSR